MRSSRVRSGEISLGGELSFTLGLRLRVGSLVKRSGSAEAKSAERLHGFPSLPQLSHSSFTDIIRHAQTTIEASVSRGTVLTQKRRA